MLKKKIEKTKICLISQFGYSLFNKKCKEQFGGGVAVQLYLLSKEFAKDNNLNVNIITGDYKASKNRIEIFQNIKLYNVLPIVRKKINYFKGLISFFLALKQINPDVIIQRRADKKITGLCALYCKLFKKIFIFSMASEQDVNGTVEKGILGKFYAYGLNNATVIIAQKKEQIIELQKYKKRKYSNIKIIKSGFLIGNKDYKKKETILWVGRAAKIKRPELFLELAKKFPSEKFIMICNIDNNDRFFKEILNRAIKISNLKFFKYIPFHDIDQYFREAKVVINTSFSEGFPNTIIQAFLTSTPVISLNINPDGIFSNYRIGFYCNNSFNEMVSCLELLLRNKKIYTTFSNNSYLYCIDNHDIRKISNQWIQLIKKIHISS